MNYVAQSIVTPAVRAVAIALVVIAAPDIAQANDIDIGIGLIDIGRADIIRIDVTDTDTGMDIDGDVAGVSNIDADVVGASDVGLLRTLDLRHCKLALPTEPPMQLSALRSTLRIANVPTDVDQAKIPLLHTTRIGSHLMRVTATSNAIRIAVLF